MRKLSIVFISTLLFSSMLIPVLNTAAESTLELAVTPEGYDDIGYILGNLGYSYDNITLSDLENLATLSAYDVIFINCAGGISEDSGSVLKSYVEAGGVIYASDWAYLPIDNAFDNAINFYNEEVQGGPKIGSQQTITANVVDSGFAAYLGSSTVTIDFDLSSWVVIQSVPTTTKQHLTGTVDVSSYGSVTVPITVSFSRGDGSVIYTSFHYEAQEGTMTETMMKYLVFKAVTENITSTVKDDLVAEGYSIAYDIRGGIDQGETETYNIEISESTDLKIVLDWIEDSLGLSVKKPDGSTLSSTGAKPKYIEITDAPVGTYTVSVTGDTVPTANKPFTLAIGTAGGDGEDGAKGWTPGFEIITVITALAIALIILRRKK